MSSKIDAEYLKMCRSKNRRDAMLTVLFKALTLATVFALTAGLIAANAWLYVTVAQHVLGAP